MAMDGLAPSTPLLLSGVLLDIIFGDPRYGLHPVRLVGRSLAPTEKFLRRYGWQGHAAGCALLFILVFTWVFIPCALVMYLHKWHAGAAVFIHVVLVYTLLALRDLFDHVRAVKQPAARGDLPAARAAIGLMVGRDIDRMDLSACRRAAIESLSENFVDGFLAALFWYVLLGLPGMLLFKVISTMDSMIGYKTPRYLRFGWCGARLDDLLVYVPARLAWFILCFAALPFPECSPRTGWSICLLQHAIVPGPNSGWSEATMAGLLRKRLLGPIWKDGELVTTIWLGRAEDAEAGTDNDLTQAMSLIKAASVISVLLSAVLLSGGLIRQRWF